MKKTCLILLTILSVASSYAQKVTKGSFSALANEKTVSISIDYSESTIDKVPFEAFLEVEDKWEEGYDEIMLKLIKSVNRNSGGIIYTKKGETNYRLVFKATSVDRDGETNGYLQLLDKDDKIVGVAEKFNANGGSFGSQTNLMGDAAERLGKKISQFVRKQIKTGTH